MEQLNLTANAEDLIKAVQGPIKAAAPIKVSQGDYDTPLKHCNYIGKFAVPYTQAQRKDGEMQTATNRDAIRWAFRVNGEPELANKVNDQTVKNVNGLLKRESFSKLSKGFIELPNGDELQVVYLTFYQVHTSYISEGQTEANQAGQIISIGNDYARDKNLWGAAMDDLTDAIRSVEDFTVTRK